MMYATAMKDGSVVFTTLVPIAVEMDGQSLAVTHVRGRKLHLRGTNGDSVCELPLELADLQADSVPGATIIFPSIDQIIEKKHPDFRSQVMSSRVIRSSDIPSDRTFRDALTDDGRTIAFDMAKARDIHRRRMRAARGPLLADLDVAYQRADESGDAAAKRAVAKKKQELRDVTDDPSIDNAANVDELKRAWPAALRGE